MFGTAQLRTTFHLPAAAPRGRDTLARHASTQARATAEVLQRAEHTLAAQAAAARREEHTPLAGVQLARPLSLSHAPASGILRLEFATAHAEGAPAVIEALARHLAPLLALEGVTRVEARLVDPRTGALLDARTLEAPAHA